MDHDFTGAMKRAVAQTRAGALMDATRTIQAALGGGNATALPEPVPGRMRLINPEPDLVIAPVLAPVSPPVAVPAAAKRKRHPLRDVVATLGQSRAAKKAAPKPAAEDLSDSSFVLRHHAGPEGKRDYRLFVPQVACAPHGLVLMLHGCTQTAADFAAGTGMNRVAQEHGLLVAYPEQTGSHNSANCWNWFQPGDQRRGAGEPAILAALTKSLMAEFGLSHDQVFVAGLSAGGAMAAVMAEAYPELFSAAGIHSGLAVGAASDVMGAFSAMRSGGSARSHVTPGARTIVFHGTADATVHPSNAAHIVAAHDLPMSAKRAHGADRKGGRAYTRSVHAAPGGAPGVEVWMIDGAGHTWSGGLAAGSYTDPAGPDASAAMVRFFLTGSGVQND
jgi:poly(hydroxyalkanoate) depolymerase family esterase